MNWRALKTINNINACAQCYCSQKPPAQGSDLIGLGYGLDIWVFVKLPGHSTTMRTTAYYSLSVLLLAAPTQGSGYEKRGKSTPLLYVTAPQQELIYKKAKGIHSYTHTNMGSSYELQQVYKMSHNGYLQVRSVSRGCK